MPRCECPVPPGGSVECPSGQIPVCIVRDGKTVGRCFPAKSQNQLLKLIGSEIGEYASELQSRRASFFKNEYFQSADGHVEITLSMREGSSFTAGSA